MNGLYPDETLVAYRNPAYWDGFVLGETGPEAAPSTGHNMLRRTIPDIAACLTGRSMLKAHLQDMRSYSPEETLGSGEIFDPKEYEPETVIAFTTESISVRLRAKRPLQQYSYPPEVFVPDQPRVRPDLNPKSSHSYGIITPSFEYMVDSGLGVVIKGPHGNRLETIQDSWVSIKNGCTRIGPYVMAHNTPIPDIVPIGKTYGTPKVCRPNSSKPPDFSPNSFTRVNHIDILGFGAPRNKQRRSITQILPRLAIGQLPSRFAGVEV